jgi:hopanoid biosynthesis associated RND transporter like protein HpnN
MTLQSLLAALARLCQRRRLAIALAGLALILLAGAGAATRLGVSTDTDAMFSQSLPWRQRQIAYARDFPQFNDLLVLVIDAPIPEQADAAAVSLAAALKNDGGGNFLSVRRPDASPYLAREGLLFLDRATLQATVDGIVDAQPFIGQLVADPSARGLFASLGMIGLGVTHAGIDLSNFTPALKQFQTVMETALAGHPTPLSWQRLLGGGVADLAGKYRFILVQPKLDYGALAPGGAATTAIRAAIANLDTVKSGQARVRITGPVALADEEFATVAEGAVTGLLASLVLITLWLFLALGTWRLIVPVLFTLATGLAATLLFATFAVGTLNLVSVGFGVLFVGIAVDFAIQYAVRYREMRHSHEDLEDALAATAGRAGGPIQNAAAATAAGFLAFTPTDFAGVAELGLIAGFGMIFAFACTMVFLPAAIALCRPRAEGAEIGFAWAIPLDRFAVQHHAKLLACFGAAALLGLALLPRLSFDSDPLHTKNPHTEAMTTLAALTGDPQTTPYSVDIMAANAEAAAALSPKLEALPLAASVISVNALVPEDQAPKLAAIADAQALLAATLAPRAPMAQASAGDLRLAAQSAYAQLQPALAKLPPDSPLTGIAAALHQAGAAPDAAILALNQALTQFLPTELDQLRVSLQAGPATLASIPEDLKRDWLTPDGRARVEVSAKPAAQNSAGLRAFAAQVQGIAPDAGGTAVTIVSSADTIIGAFRLAAAGAFVSITLILLLVLRRLLDTVLVLAPLLLAALLTVLAMVLAGQSLNFANIIALPLLLGVGVSFNVYFVMNWRAGRPGVLASATARAVMFSALTTGSAFGSLALSAHPGTASMGVLLLISLGCTLIGSLVLIPALLAAIGPAATPPAPA